MEKYLFLHKTNHTSTTTPTTNLHKFPERNSTKKNPTHEKELYTVFPSFLYKIQYLLRPFSMSATTNNVHKQSLQKRLTVYQNSPQRKCAYRGEKPPRNKNSGISTHFRYLSRHSSIFSPLKLVARIVLSSSKIKVKGTDLTPNNLATLFSHPIKSET